MAPPRKKRTGNPTPRRKTGRRKANSAAVNTPAKSKSLSDLLSLNSIGDLSKKTKQWLQYLQQADRVLDTLYVAGNSMNESGLLEKIIKEKGKNLSTGDLASILTALINTPMADQLFKGWGGGESGESDTSADSTKLPAPELPAANPPQGTVQGQQHPGVRHTPPAQLPYGNPQYPYQQPHYQQQFQQPYQQQYQQQLPPQHQPQYQQPFQPYYQQPNGQPPIQSQANYQHYQVPPISLLNTQQAYNPYYTNPLSEMAPGTKKKTAK